MCAEPVSIPQTSGIERACEKESREETHQFHLTILEMVLLDHLW